MFFVRYFITVCCRRSVSDSIVLTIPKINSKVDKFLVVICVKLKTQIMILNDL